ncbi:MAG: twin-arginine translocase subunit TatC [Bacteroidia bacterium]|nr:twin-arginine translocase subunit TatC [Bacteroidia bacterium]
MSKTKDDLTFLEHLEELRWHIIRSLIAIVVVGSVFFGMKGVTEGLIMGPTNPDFVTYGLICKLSQSLGLGEGLCFSPPAFAPQNIGVAEAFTLHITVSFLIGFVAAFPYVFYEFWKFIRPGLYDKEQKAIRGIVIICSLLFILGVGFGYFIIAPFAITFLLNYDFGGTNIPTMASYVGSMKMFTLPAGLIFELPIVVYFLSKVGLITSAFMKKYQKHAFVIILILAAILTPPDIITQFLIAIPLYILYQVSILIAKRMEKKREKEMN